MTATIIPAIIKGAGLPIGVFSSTAQIGMQEKASVIGANADHWIFDKGGASGLIGRSNATPKSLTAVGGAHIWNAKSLTLSGLASTGFRSHLADSNQGFVAGVCKWPSGSTPFGGSKSASGINAVLAVGSANEIRANISGTTPGFVDLNTGITPTAGQWVFIAQAWELTGAGNKLFQYIGGFGQQENTSLTGAMTTNGAAFIGLGSPDSAASGPALEVFEFMAGDSYASFVANIAAIYERSGERLRVLNGGALA